MTRFRRGRLHGPDGRENDIFKRAPADLLSACGRFVPKTMQRNVYCVHVSSTVQYRCFLGNQSQQRQNSRSLAEPSKSVVVCCSACCYLIANDICRVFYYSPGFDKQSPDVVFVSFILITRRLSENPPAYHLVHLRAAVDTVSVNTLCEHVLCFLPYCLCFSRHFNLFSVALSLHRET